MSDPRRNSLLVALAAGLPFLTACPDATGDGGGDKKPYVEDWQTVVDAVSFPSAVGCIGADACSTAADEDTCNMAPEDLGCEWVASAVVNLQVGGRLTGDNFANRGDIEVYYTNDDDTISVQMRRFTFAGNDEEGEENLVPMNFWAFAEEASASPDPANDCTTVWKDGCEIRVWYDGMIQPLRDGADFRVYLPKGWEGNLTVATEDAEQELETYPRRSNVIVKGAAGSVEVASVGSGTVEVEMSADLEEAPLQCTAEEHAACDDVGWPSMARCTGGADCDGLSNMMCDENAECTWVSCDCTDFGSVVVTTISGRAADVTVEVPEDLWANVRMTNDEPGLNPGSDPLCLGDLVCDEFDSCALDDGQLTCGGPGECWKIVAELNDPGDLAAMAGYRVDLTSDRCTIVPTARTPDDFNAAEDVQKGEIQVCSDCLDIDVP